ncbi:MAG: hypothetical protein MR606_00390 [Mollicutes bacterium]|nr:hypothetical protein [Mollicutes bacterium]MDD7263747.1 hypothetical protein [bacterium]MDY4979797.1 hypothetical protein [Candidatus Onthovivens sp.]
MKKKNLLIALIGLTTISLAGVGFATWVVGVTQKQVDSNLQVEVDDALNDSVFLKASFATGAKVAIAETTTVTKPNKGLVSVTDNSTSGQGLKVDINALSFEFAELKYIVGNAISADATPAYLKLELDNTKNASNVVQADNVKLTDKKGARPVKVGEGTEPELHYLQFKEYIKLDSTTTDSTPDSSSTTYTLKDKKFKFLWGDFFGNTTNTAADNKQPSTYYNELYAGVENPEYETLLDASNKAYQELTAMKSVLTAPSNVFKITAKLLTADEFNAGK